MPGGRWLGEDCVRRRRCRCRVLCGGGVRRGAEMGRTGALAQRGGLIMYTAVCAVRTDGGAVVVASGVGVSLAEWGL